MQKMLEVKQNEGKGTLMHYVVDLIEKKYPELLEFYQDMPTVPAAARMTPLAQMTSDLSKLIGDLHTVEKELNQLEDDDKFFSVMTKFHQMAEDRVTKLKEAFEGLQTMFKETLKFYAEDLTTDTETFFGSLQRFVGSFNQARHDKKVWKQQAIAAKQSAERMKKLGVKGKALPTGPPGQGGPSPMNPFAGIQKGSLDSMISSLKTGTDQRLHRKSFRGRINAGDKKK